MQRRPLIDTIAFLIQSHVTMGNSSWDIMAKTILITLLDPTEEMVKRGDWVRGNHDSTWKEGNSTRSIFRAMIHEALTDTWKKAHANPQSTSIQ